MSGVMPYGRSAFPKEPGIMELGEELDDIGAINSSRRDIASGCRVMYVVYSFFIIGA
jgi:hypothetical protein